MDRGQHVAAALAPWQAAAARLAGRPPPEGAAFEDSLRELQALLATLAEGREAVPAEVPASEEPLEGWLRQATRPAGFNHLRRRRDLLLRLATWRTLEALAQAMPDGEDALDALQAWMGQPGLDVPPGLGPSLAYAGSASALRFFDQDLRAALQRLAQRHDAAGARFAELARAAPYEATAAAAHGWSRAWSAAVAAVYLDWLRQGAQGRLEAALQGLWREGAVRFRAPSGLVVLPTRERSMHIDLWTTLPAAQALEHRAARFERAGDPWHRVALAMHDLGERDRGTRAGVRTLYRGLGVEMLYQAVFADRGLAALAPRAATERAPMNTPQIVVDVPLPKPGQQANLELVLRWHAGPEGSRYLGAAAAPPLNERQRGLIEAWRSERGGGDSAAARLSLPLLDWRPAAPEDRFADDEGRPLQALGHGALWRAAGEGCDWLDVALLCRGSSATGWQPLPLVLHEEAIEGELRTWLLLAPGVTAPDPGALRAALATRACWVARRAGVGVFVMAGVALDAQG